MIHAILPAGEVLVRGFDVISDEVCWLDVGHPSHGSHLAKVSGLNPSSGGLMPDGFGMWVNA